MEALNWDIVNYEKPPDEADYEASNAIADEIPSMGRTHRTGGLNVPRTPAEEAEHLKILNSVRDGDYVYTNEMQGVFYQGGILAEPSSGD